MRTTTQVNPTQYFRLTASGVEPCSLQEWMLSGVHGDHICATWSQGPITVLTFLVGISSASYATQVLVGSRTIHYENRGSQEEAIQLHKQVVSTIEGGCLSCHYYSGHLLMRCSLRPEWGDLSGCPDRAPLTSSS